VSEHNRTPWFEPPMNPCRVGAYEVRGAFIPPGFKAYWNGYEFPRHMRIDAWRGLTEPAKFYVDKLDN
jgi:hypothetical protein